MKGRLYKAGVRNVMCYEAECWTIEEDRHQMRMIRMCGKTLLDRVPSAVLRAKPEVEVIKKTSGRTQAEMAGPYRKNE